MEIIRQPIPEVILVRPRKFEDARGYFCETYNGRRAADLGLPVEYVQDNVSRSLKKGTIRGLHFQKPPYAQDKLVSVLKGRILDVAVDIRHGSPTFGEHVAVELSGDSMEQLLIPKGFAHAFCTLEDDTTVFYKVSGYYAPEHDTGIVWNDPDLAVQWPFTDNEVILSDKDRGLPRLSEQPEIFSYGRNERKRA